MLCSETGQLENASRFKNLICGDMKTLDTIVGSLIDLNNGNGDVRLRISGGKIQYFEPTARVYNTDQEKSA